jgi:poly-gamma-glutamate synthesis protein (capsule biosynthesis protein)
MKLLRRSNFLFLLVILMLLVACSSGVEEQNAALTTKSMEVLAATETHLATSVPPTPSPLPPTETPTPTIIPKFWIADYVPETIANYVKSELGEQVQLTADKSAATYQLDIGGNIPVAEWVYGLVAPFPTIPDGVTLNELRAAWTGTSTTEPSANAVLMLDNNTYFAFLQLWGENPSEVVQIVPTDELLQVAWEQQPSWSIIPFENLDPRWKVLEIDRLSPIQKDFDPQAYPLTISFGLNADPGISISPLTNRNPNKMTDIMLTGVTALVRGTALTMERQGITYPGEDIAPLTRAVDFMHVNNEIPFTPDCPFPDLYPELLVFCSDVDYLELLQYIGTDFVEVSGDHFGDHGPEGTLFTLDLYDEVGLPYYGGGRNLEDGRQPYFIEHNGNKIAILGCNAKGSHYYAPADEVTPGAVPCDFNWMETEIARLKEAGYLVIVTFQHVEYYTFVAQPDLVRDFGRMAEAGATIVSGSQSHQAHGIAFQNGAFIHYGLGNLFFDQYQFCENANCDYAFMDRHIIYDGRHISTELIPIRFIDMARPRLMTPDEKAWFLGLIFEASGWGVSE